MEHLHTCLACGNAPTIHFMEKFSAFVDTEVSPWFRPLDTLRRRIEPLVNPILDKLELWMMGACNTFHIGKFLDQADHRTPMRAVCFWESAKKRGIHMYEFRLFGRPFDLYIATYKDRVIVFDGLPRPGTHSSASLDWMDDKAIIHKRFSATGIPVAMGGVARSKRQAIEIFTKTPHPVIIKPNIGSRSRHTTIHITTEADLVRAYRCAKELSPWVIVEQELTGRVYRATVIGGSVVGVLRRDPAHVVGNGHLSIRTLVEIENKNPLRRGPIFHLLPVNTTSTKYLSKQGLDWNTIPKAGQYIELGDKASRGAGGSTADVTDSVHPDNMALFEKIGRVLDDPLVGIDFIIEDMSRSWKTQKNCGVIECNSMPFIDLHHYPLYGKPRDAAGALWDLIYKNS